MPRSARFRRGGETIKTWRISVKEDLIKRYGKNPVLKANPQNDWENHCVLNPAVIYDDENERFVMLYRAAGNDVKHVIRLGLATSEDGFTFTRCSDKPVFDCDENDADGGCVEDPRLTKIDGAYFLTYAARAYAPGRYWLPYDEYVKQGYEIEKQCECQPAFLRTNHTVTYLATTCDFHRFKRLGRITDSRYDDRDVYLFDRKVNGKYVKISRTKYNDGSVKMPSIYISFSDDVVEWGEQTLLLTGREWWETARIGGACPPIYTERGWFMLYHGVDDRGTYRVGAVILDKDDPRKVLARTKNYLFEPEAEYERVGLYNCCVFPTANILRGDTLYIYYGCADKYVSVATADFEALFDSVLYGAAEKTAEETAAAR